MKALVGNAPTIMGFGNSLDNRSLLGQNKKINTKDPGESSKRSKAGGSLEECTAKGSIGGYISLTI